MEQITFSIKIKTGDLYKFLLNYNYKTFGGIFGVILSVASLVYLGANYSELDNGKRLLFFILGLLFTVVQPIQLLQRAAMQISKNPAFRYPLQYEIKEDGIYVSQNGQQEIILWDSIVNVMETKSQILVYTSRVNACIWPKTQISEKIQNVRQALRDNLDEKVCKCKK